MHKPRKMLAADFDAVVAMWRAAKREAYPYIEAEKSRTIAEDSRFFSEKIAARCDLWVIEDEQEIAGFLAIVGNYIERLYVHPKKWRRGFGTRLLELAKELSPEGLELHTHQQNRRARAFYEKHSFRAVHFGHSPPPENLPDIEYRRGKGA